VRVSSPSPDTFHQRAVCRDCPSATALRSTRDSLKPGDGSAARAGLPPVRLAFRPAISLVPHSRLLPPCCSSCMCACNACSSINHSEQSLPSPAQHAITLVDEQNMAPRRGVCAAPATARACKDDRWCSMLACCTGTGINRTICDVQAYAAPPGCVERLERVTTHWHFCRLPRFE